MNSNKLPDIFSLKNKVVILTGSAGRLGSRFAEILCNAGANLVLVDIDQKNNLIVERKLMKTNPKNILTLTLDISKSSDIKKMIASTMNKFGKIDVLINNAHSVPRNNPKLSESFEKFPDDIWEIMVSETLRGLFLCTREVGKIMSKQNSGVVINISSIYGLVGPDQRIYGNNKLNSPVAYSVTKGGLVNMTRYLASYWHGKNIRVNTLTLGGVLDKKLHDVKFIKNYSEKTILGRMASKEDYDGALIFLASDASSYMTGSNLIVDGGWTAW
ncbi:Dehydrogenase [metagenome]